MAADPALVQRARDMRLREARRDLMLLRAETCERDAARVKRMTDELGDMLRDRLARPGDVEESVREAHRALVMLHGRYVDGAVSIRAALREMRESGTA